MSASNKSFSKEDFIAPRKRCKYGIMNEESDGSGSSLESGDNSEAPLLPVFHRLSYATPVEIFKQMALSLIPPLHPSRVLKNPLLDPVGPTLVVTLLISLLSYTSSKTAPFKYQTLEALLLVGLYMLFASIIVFFLGHVFTGGRYLISFLQVMILLGYSLIGHVLSLAIPFALYSYKEPPPEIGQVAGKSIGIMSKGSMGGFTPSADVDLGMTYSGHLRGGLDPVSVGDSLPGKSNDDGDSPFLICLPFLAGPATMRLALVLLSPIQSPPGRMIMGTILCVCHLLLLIVLHASFVHPTFQYGSRV